MNRFWTNRPTIALLVAIALGATVFVAGVGAIGAFVVATVAALAGRRQGSFGDLGFRAPASWPRLLGLTCLYGLMLQCITLLLIEPALARWTGAAVDISHFDAVRGNLSNFLALLAIGWVVGGFLEELAFRGFVVGRVHWLLGSSPAGAWIAVLVAAIPFGLAHAYQGAAGMIATGLAGFAMGAIYVLHRFNLWYAIFTHGFTNTFGITAIYLDLDRQISSLLFG
jgi:membrane protease YdiL (CAAX protease family)